MPKRINFEEKKLLFRLYQFCLLCTSVVCLHKSSARRSWQVPTLSHSGSAKSDEECLILQRGYIASHLHIFALQIRSYFSLSSFIMDQSITINVWHFTLLLVLVALACCYQGKAQMGTGMGTGTVAGGGSGAGVGAGTGGFSGTAGGTTTGTVSGGVGGGGGEEEPDPAAIAAKALLCFDEKYIYSSCEESYRLTESGEIHVSEDYVDEYCNGPCLTETHLLLSCIENIMLNFEFFNKATIQDVRDTISGGCGHGSKRGNFNVAEHIQAEEGSASKAKHDILLELVLGLVLALAGLAVLL